MSAPSGDSRRRRPTVIGNEILPDGTDTYIALSPVLVIHEDRLKSKLHRHRPQPLSWTTPLATAVALLLGLCTANFKKTLGMGPDFWSALFGLLFIAAVIGAALLFRTRTKASWVEDVIADIRQGARLVSNSLDGDQTVDVETDENDSSG